MRLSSFPRRPRAAFTLVELLVSVALLAFLMLILEGFTEAASRAWREGQSRTDTFQSARTSLELLARELTPAVVDTRMQLVVAPGSILTAVGAQNIADGSPALLWMAPLGDEGSLRCVGYYLSRDDTKKFYRLKRLFIAPTDATGNASAYFPRMANLNNPRDPTVEPNPVDASWFTQTWDVNAFDDQNPSNNQAVVSSAADGVIAFWAQAIDPLGHPIPAVSNSTVHPKSALYFNSAAYSQSATSTPFDNGQSFQYLAKTPQSLKANRVPAALDLTIVLLDSATLARGVTIPIQGNVYDSTGALDVTASVQAYTALLQQNRIYNARTFSTRTKLVNGN